MRCPECDSLVSNPSMNVFTDKTLRRYKCSCGNQLTTVEISLDSHNDLRKLLDDWQNRYIEIRKEITRLTNKRW